jgi:hypothetical protein
MENKKDLVPSSYPREEWARGPWDNEPDRVDFIHAGYSCFILRNQSGNWCGYVGIPESHPCFGKDYNDVPVEVHGGLTYADLCSPPICHIPEPGMPDKVWWLGFDTAHWSDLTPLRLIDFGDDVTYKDVTYVTTETKELAEQLKELENASLPNQS